MEPAISEPTLTMPYINRPTLSLTHAHKTAHTTMIGLTIGPSWLQQAAVAAVSVQRLTVPDLVVVDQPQLNQQQQQPPPPIQLARSTSDPPGSHLRTQSIHPPPNNLAQQQQQQPEAASLINFQDPSSGSINASGGSHEQQQQQLLTFECLISYDRKKDKNLIIKWHHDDRVEPIYQWIVELDKISIAPQYKPYILANNSTASQRALQLDWQQQQQPRTAVGNSTANVNSNNQLLEAGFRLIRPSKELGGKFVSTSVVSAPAPDIIRFPTFGEPEEDVASPSIK